MWALDCEGIEIPERFPSPFATDPASLARRAARSLQTVLRDRFATLFDAPESGKMFGVLVARAPDGSVGFLSSFAGMLGDAWHVEGFAAPVFDPAARDRVWLSGQDDLARLDRDIVQIESADETCRTREALAAMRIRQGDELAALRARHRSNREARHARRNELGEHDDVALAALAQQSRADKAEHKRLLHTHGVERARLEEEVAAIDAQLRRLRQERSQCSRQLLPMIQETYEVASFDGVIAALRTLFAPAEPPGGAGDCAGPKLLAEAYRRGLRPLAMAEFWWGPPPRTGGRHSGHFYPACRGKCGPVLTHMLGGLDAEPAPIFATTVVDDDAPRTLFEDAWIAIVSKPAGLLSVPGRGARLQDSVQIRLRARYPRAQGPLLAHRLDLDTSGLLVVGKDESVYKDLQRMFWLREIEKRYVAWVDGALQADRGTVTLALRSDLDDRPRQIHDPVHGKSAETRWVALERRGTRTRLALYPLTGRTHQLRVHAAHPQGLGAPIVGDRLYGRPESRLLLHAEALRFRHPRTGAHVEVEDPAPF